MHTEIESSQSTKQRLRAATNLTAEVPGTVLKRLCGDFLSCIHHLNSTEGCGTTPFCPDCVLRQVAETVSADQKTVKKTAEMQLIRDGVEKTVWFQLTATPLSYAEESYAIVTFEEITELVMLRNILPVCMHCRKVRDDKNYWHQIEDYLRLNAKVKISHGICEDCLGKHYPKYAKKTAEK